MQAGAPRLLTGRIVQCLVKVQRPSPPGMAASTLEPPFTRSPTFTRSTASAGITTSTREPNLIRPTRCPRSTVSPFVVVEHDAPRQQAGNLLEGHLNALAAHGHCILLVALCRGRIHGVQILALLIVHAAEDAADRRAVHMTSKTLRKMLIRCRWPSGVLIVDGLGHQPVSRRDNQTRRRRGWSARDRGKTTKKQPPAAPAAMPHAQLPVDHASTAATTKRLKP